MADAAHSPGRLGVFQTLREGLSREVFYRPDPPLLPLASLVLVLGLGAL
ncbi:MAG: hypothetical protein IM643_06965, partial [Phenylobacterium sp.]|nr:hypothetical protein [Phenylobacterium sp.]